MTIADNRDYLLNLGVRRAIAHLRAGRRLDAEIALEVAIYAADDVENEKT